MPLEIVTAPMEFAGEARSVFLAGGITGCEDWQTELCALLRDVELVVLNPRRADFDLHDPSVSVGQIEWEFRHLRRAWLRAFWFPPQTLCPITLFELGAWSAGDAPLCVGVHPDYARKLDVHHQLRLVRPDVTVVDSLSALANDIRRLTLQ